MRKYYLLNWAFVGSLILLFINDHFLKFEYSNWITGKLSDFTGIFILHLIFAFIFPKKRFVSVLLTILFFIFWKSPLSETFIKIYNYLSPIRTERVVDYSDFIAFSVLPLSFYLIQNLKKYEFLKIKKVHSAFIAIPTFIILISEAPPLSHYYTYTDGDFRCYKCNTTIDISKNDLIKKLNDRNIKLYEKEKIKLDSSHSWVAEKYNRYKFYRIDELIIEKDTLRNIDFYIESKNNGKTKIYFSGMNMPKNLSQQQVDSKIRKYYKKMIFEELKEKLK